MPHGHRGQVWGVLLALVVLLVVVGGCANDDGEDSQATLQPPPTAPFTPGPPGTPQGPPGSSTPPSTGEHCPVVLRHARSVWCVTLGNPAGRPVLTSTRAVPSR